MTSDQIIELVGSYFDNNTDFHTANSLTDVESIFRHMEKFCQDNDLHFEHDVETSDFEDLSVSPNPEEERTEIKFEIPLLGTDLQFEFIYYKLDEGTYRVWCDVDYYFEMDEDDSY